MRVRPDNSEGFGATEAGRPDGDVPAESFGQIAIDKPPPLRFYSRIPADLRCEGMDDGG